MAADPPIPPAPQSSSLPDRPVSVSRLLPLALALGLGVVVSVTSLVSPPAAPVQALAQAQVPAWLAPHRDNAAKLLSAAMADQFAWDRLAELTDIYGARLTGSDNLTRAITWAADTMRADGLERVRTEKVMGPKWVRGAESLEIIDPPHHVIPLLGLGGSIATAPQGLEADVMVVSTMDELQKRSSEVKGRIVLFDVPYTNYGETVVYRAGGARLAAQHGAVGMLLRSVGPMGLRTTHTGGMQYGDDAPKIPAAAISVEDAQRIHRIVNRGRKVRVRLKMEARFEPDVESANVIGELRGRERPEEVVLVGCHFDSWDAATGASDDAVGCIAVWEGLRLMRKLGIQPRRTVRLVLFTNEENGLRGGTAYRDAYAKEAENHVLAIESDSGVFQPARLGFTGPEAARRIIDDIGTLLAGIDMHTVGPGGGGADIGPIAQLGKVPMMAYGGDATKYFTIHHTPADMIERILPAEVSKAVASLAVMTYVVADMEERLPK
ncbi:MAG: M20/M25/M40 family metallo-hydrolase [Acidobacteria bacterium]|nr:M20/M25/M40 family metallo-hydrolase [Acidobacteriota bacterium]